MIRSVRFFAAAIFDLESIGDYIAQFDIDRARTYTEALINECMRVANNPYQYQARDEYGDGVRAVIFRRYLILFTIGADGTILIERIVHGARDIGSLELPSRTGEGR